MVMVAEARAAEVARAVEVAARVKEVAAMADSGRSLQNSNCCCMESMIHRASSTFQFGNTRDSPHRSRYRNCCRSRYSLHRNYYGLTASALCCRDIQVVQKFSHAQSTTNLPPCLAMKSATLRASKRPAWPQAWPASPCPMPRADASTFAADYLHACPCIR